MFLSVQEMLAWAWMEVLCACIDDFACRQNVNKWQNVGVPNIRPCITSQIEIHVFISPPSFLDKLKAFRWLMEYLSE